MLIDIRKYRVLVLATALFALVGCEDDDDAAPPPGQPAVTGLSLDVLGRYESGVFDEGAAEIVTFDPASGYVFVINAQSASVDVLDIADPTHPAKVGEIDVTAYGAVANSIDVANGLLAVAIEAETQTDPGVVVFFDTATRAFVSQATVGALPDMVTFTPDGTKVLTADEGQPSDDYTVDPAGSVSVIDVTNPEAPTVATAGFTAFDGSEDALRASGVRIFGPGASASQDFEPEYIAYSADGAIAYVSLQENNALAIVDVASATVTDVLPLGFKDHSLPGNGLDASDDDGEINIASWPVLGMYMPDSIASFTVGGQTYLITANEGDAREYTFDNDLGEEETAFAEEQRIEDLTLDPTAFPDAAELQTDAAIGRLTVTTTLGDGDGDGDYEALYAFGGRSFSIWNGADASLVFDSGDALEQITAAAFPDDFNSDNDENDSFEKRSDAKGPEPEGVAVAQFGASTIAFIGLERIGGVVAYDVTDPAAPVFLDYLNPRDFSVADVEADLSAVGDLGPEGLVVIPAEDSPTGEPLLVVGNEVSGTTAVYAIDLTTQ